MAALLAGRIGYLQAMSIVEASYGIPADKLPRYEQLILATAVQQTPGQTRALVGRTAARVDPEGFTARTRDAQRDADAGVVPSGDGMATLWAHLPGVDAAVIDTAMTAWARAVKAGRSP